MKDKIIKEVDVKSNGEDITISIIQTDKGIVVKTEGSDKIDIIVNSETVYSKYDNEDYKYIPTELRDFISDNLCSWGDGIIVKDKDIQCDIEYDGVEYFVQIPKNRARNKTIYINNWFNSYSKIEDYGVEIPNGKENEEEFINNIKEIGCDFVYRWDGNEYENTYGLKFDLKDFDKDKVIKCFEMWQEYNGYLEKFIDKI